jgi:hypothetical protein
MLVLTASKPRLQSTNIILLRFESDIGLVIDIEDLIAPIQLLDVLEVSN